MGQRGRCSWLPVLTTLFVLGNAIGTPLVIKSLQGNTSDLNGRIPCPLLYTRVGSNCLALSVTAKVAWPEARLFCQSICGNLLTFNDFNSFGTLLQYLNKSALTTDFWIGGQYETDSNSWKWMDTDVPMPLGPPFWAVKYMNGQCVPRTPSPTPNTCYHYQQSPIAMTQGYCSALTFEQYYMITDEVCQEPRSPLCLLNKSEVIDGGHAEFNTSVAQAAMAVVGNGL